jgi:hypothetical protein
MIDFSPVADEMTAAWTIHCWDRQLTPDDRFALERLFWDFYDQTARRLQRSTFI